MNEFNSGMRRRRPIKNDKLPSGSPAKNKDATMDKLTTLNYTPTLCNSMIISVQKDFA